MLLVPLLRESLLPGESSPVEALGIERELATHLGTLAVGEEVCTVTVASAVEVPSLLPGRYGTLATLERGPAGEDGKPTSCLRGLRRVRVSEAKITAKRVQASLADAPEPERFAESLAAGSAVLAALAEGATPEAPEWRTTILASLTALARATCPPREQGALVAADYLKLFQMDRPVLRGYDVIARDEAQDLNHCTFDIVRGQAASFVMVGDAAQAIYSFRGATNALILFEAQERLPLTRSFRFGRGIASLANALLSAFKEGFDRPLVGVGQPQETRMSIDTRQSFAVIARTNAAVFEEAVAFLSLNRRYHFVGGSEGYKLEKILDTYYLSAGDRGLMRDAYLRSFACFDDLCELAEEAEDPELKHLVCVVQDYGHRVPGLIDEIKSRRVDVGKEDWRRLEGVFLSTAHKSKGLEFEQVWLADDYLRFFEDGRELRVDEVEQEEINIIYVALTRARAAIRLCTSFEEWLQHRRLMPHSAT